MKHNSEMILLVGAGYMGREYAKVLKALGANFKVVGRSQRSTDLFKKELGVDAAPGGIKKWLKDNVAPTKAIIAATEDQLGSITRILIDSGCKSILVEKPGGLNADDIIKVEGSTKRKKAKVYVGYNRRFYASTQKALEIIKKEGVKSFIFDFTERSYIVEKAAQSREIKREWFLHNSSHVIDMAFFMGGWPKKITSYKKGGLSWHPSGSIYSGAGISHTGAIFSYHANWSSAGRWSIEVMTPKTKLIFKPLEKLQIQRYGEMSVEDYPIDDELDIKFKPGLFKQVQAFLKDPKKIMTLSEQVKHLSIYKKINGNNT